MNFMYYVESTGSNIPKKFDTLSDAKTFLNDRIKSYVNIDILMISFIVKVDDKYIIFSDTLRNNIFIDDAIDYVKQWQEDTNKYIECIMLPYYGNILTIEISY